MLKNIDHLDHDYFMGEALREARLAGERGDLPIGSVIVHYQGEIISRGSNKIHTWNNRTKHAEINALNSGAEHLSRHARECVIYSTVEPCVMCLPTIILANIRNVVFGVKDAYMEMDTFIESNNYVHKRLYNYVGDIRAEESEELLKKYAPEAADRIFSGV
ncbi:nucleoside deaminase [Halalkalibacillus sediminis]|nr:nucleoside deaminase [Halalkalibacillus sediminis]